MSLYHQEGDGPTEKRMMTESRCGQMASEVCSQINNWHLNNQRKEKGKLFVPGEGHYKNVITTIHSYK